MMCYLEAGSNLFAESAVPCMRMDAPNALQMGQYMASKAEAQKQIHGQIQAILPTRVQICHSLLSAQPSDSKKALLFEC